ncbi:MAG: glycosyltransferase [Deltaproteobacteria bacterium]|jgi:glycosyltransferase involved in cell wall biosynthesis|nr:glycosyltransferase [Deltaproteobacteria bacterium]
MLPGAGASPSHLRKLSCLKDPRFGTRVQHILNDTTLKSRFLEANKYFSPEIVIANNSHWSIEELREIEAERHLILPGAVDVELFSPSIKSFDRNKIIIGNYIRKNPSFFLKVFSKLPDNFFAHLYGNVDNIDKDIHHRLSKNKRIFLKGPLFNYKLRDFYRSLDLLITSDTGAGWCNPAAETMSCGIPAVLSPHGTIDFARHMFNSLVLTSLSVDEAVKYIHILAEDSSLKRTISDNARKSMYNFSWNVYTKKMLNFISEPLKK